jgi:hypothetical protein
VKTWCERRPLEIGDVGQAHYSLGVLMASNRRTNEAIEHLSAAADASQLRQGGSPSPTPCAEATRRSIARSYNEALGINLALAGAQDSPALRA